MVRAYLRYAVAAHAYSAVTVVRNYHEADIGRDLCPTCTALYYIIPLVLAQGLVLLVAVCRVPFVHMGLFTAERCVSTT